MNIDKRFLIGGAVLAGGFLFMRRASAATAAGPSLGGVASGGSASPFQSSLLQALTTAAAPAPSPTYALQQGPAPLNRLVSFASAAVAPAPTPAPYMPPAPAPAPVQSGSSWGTQTDAGTLWWTPETYG